MTNIEIDRLICEAETIRQERDEPGFEVDLPGLQVDRDVETGHVIGIRDGAVRKPFAKNEMTAYFKVRRGVGANARQKREWPAPQLRGLFENSRWKDVKQC